MNALESRSITSPFNKTDECAVFVIDNPAEGFVLSGIATKRQRYTFSLWLKADAVGSVSVGGDTFPATTAWKKHSVTFTATSEDVPIVFDVAGTYYIYHAQLEIGNKATDWTPAHEDVEADIAAGDNALRETIEEQSTSILQDAENIIMSALETYTKTGDFDAYKETVTTQLEIMAGEITMNFTNTTEQINTVDGEVQSKFTELYNYIVFSGGGITINESTGLRLALAGGQIALYNGETQLGLWHGSDFYCGNIIVKVNERAQFGNFAWIPRSDGSLMFSKVGG